MTIETARMYSCGFVRKCTALTILMMCQYIVKIGPGHHADEKNQQKTNINDLFYVVGELHVL